MDTLQDFILTNQRILNSGFTTGKSSIRRNMAQINKVCPECGGLGHSKFYCPVRKRKPISQRGKETLKYEHFRDKIALPKLIEKYGYICSVLDCSITENLDVDHKKTRGAHPELKYTISNLRLVCRPHHRQITDGGKLKFKKIV
jgi:5-methylcytosine-specific restriction endonuclease McrA